MSSQAEREAESLAKLKAQFTLKQPAPIPKTKPAAQIPLRIIPAPPPIPANRKPLNIKEIPIFTLIPAPELTGEHVCIDWLIEDILEQGSLNLLFGEPSAGKSLFALDWAFCIAGGIDWHNHRTTQVDVVIVAGEGHLGIKRRLKALEVKYDRKAPEMLFISQQPAQLSDPVNAQWVANSIKAKCKSPGLVIIDTLHRNMEGDENSSQDIGIFIHNIDIFIRPLGAAVLIVHHSGHGAKDRSRGSSSIRAAMDGEFLATKNDSGITLTCNKAKDFEALAPLQFTLKPVKLDWLDNDGEAMSSVYLEFEGNASNSGKRRKLSARDDAILTSLNEAINEHGVSPTHEIKTKFGGFDSFVDVQQKIVHIDHWREKAYRTITVDGKDDNAHAKKMAFKRCRDKLFNNGFTVEYGDYAWRVFNS
ncbi:MAG: AAA family ATPase [Methylococcaceae bacterium]